MGVPLKFHFFCYNEPLWLTHHNQVSKLWRLPNTVEVFSPNLGTYKLSIFAYLSSFQEDNVGQTIWDEVRCNWEDTEEHIENLGIHWEPIGNLMGKQWELGNTLRTHWEFNGKTVRTWWKQQKYKKSNTIVAIPHWLTKNYISTWVHHLFWPMLMAGAWICDDIETWVRFDKLKVFHSPSKNSWMSTQAWRRCHYDWPKCTSARHATWVSLG
jgi:hypothetical protein